MENNRYGLYYNHKTIGDVLLIEFKPNEYPTRVEKHDNVVALYDNDDLVGINVFNISDIIKIKADGFIHHLNNDVTDVLNLLLTSKGLKPLPYLKDSGFRIAKIVDIEEHPDSDHLHICKVDIGEEEPLLPLPRYFHLRGVGTRVRGNQVQAQLLQPRARGLLEGLHERTRHGGAGRQAGPHLHSTPPARQHRSGERSGLLRQRPQDRTLGP